jgi:hypothetical protein
MFRVCDVLPRASRRASFRHEAAGVKQPEAKFRATGPQRGSQGNGEGIGVLIVLHATLEKLVEGLACFGKPQPMPEAELPAWAVNVEKQLDTKVNLEGETVAQDDVFFGDDSPTIAGFYMTKPFQRVFGCRIYYSRWAKDHAGAGVLVGPEVALGGGKIFIVAFHAC